VAGCGAIFKPRSQIGNRVVKLKLNFFLIFPQSLSVNKNIENDVKTESENILQNCAIV
jgi:hypothetical protein